jgi:hypothetical protein
MLWGAFCASCACAAHNKPSVKSAIEAKRDGLFKDDFMVGVNMWWLVGD